jgi:hypothetical protein
MQEATCFELTDPSTGLLYVQDKPPRECNDMSTYVTSVIINKCINSKVLKFIAHAIG